MEKSIICNSTQLTTAGRGGGFGASEMLVNTQKTVNRSIGCLPENLQRALVFLPFIVVIPATLGGDEGTKVGIMW